MIPALLLVDDDPTLRRLWAKAFRRRGYEVHEAANHQEALAAARQTSFEKAVVDLKIDQESGLQLIPLLLELQPHLKLVIVTGYSSIATAVEAIKLGAVNYLCKPADADDILQAFTQQQGNPHRQVAPEPHSVNRLEWEHIQKILSENQGNISATARALGMHRRTLQRKLQKKPVSH